VLVIGADPVQVARARELWSRLERERIALVGVVQNRVRVWQDAEAPPPHDTDAQEEARSALTKALAGAGLPNAEHAARELTAAAARYASLAERDLALAARLARALPVAEHDVRRVPLFAEDVHALEGLRRMADVLSR
jgi:hypothetical protein